MPTSVPLATASLPSANATEIVFVPTSVVNPVTDCSLVLYTFESLLPVIVTVTSSVIGVISNDPGTVVIL